ncbi:MAG: bifunctional diaminohydroxyphosphoribosylaminopyrimidine deaminase/5-amino-6-(5-phosphoribosylamino)uracil reductase RibD [Acidobacteria bacterium]|nr:bifunctional diaminohydroxyphosphoribosylaminopyrimidine deaminase/5-amino-6-(5-phosphoribosylamino)uracil reductase RibD [Acidobacteriota bacterium]
MTDTDYMERALLVARRGCGRTAPNPLVGAVVVTPEGVVVGSAHHERSGEPHAEALALAAAGERARGSTLYCTLEPCCHHGRTGPCVDRIVAAGVARVVAAIEDPDPRVRGGGVRYLEAHDVDVSVGVRSAEARKLNRGFFTAMTERRPFIILKAATSLDGRMAAAPGRRTKLTSPPADRVAQMTRAEVDAIAVGSGTVLIDDPLLTAREVYRARPLVRAICDRRLRTPPSARVVATLENGPVVVLTTAAQLDSDRAARLTERGVHVRAFDGDDLVSGFRALREFEVNSLLLEGGAALQTAAWDADVVDAVHLYIAPVVLGSEGVPFLDGRQFTVADLENVEAFSCGPDTVIQGDVHRSH